MSSRYGAQPPRSHHATPKRVPKHVGLASFLGEAQRAGGEKPLRSRWGAWRTACTLCLQVCGALEVIHSLLKGSPAQEQLFAFLFEPGHVEVLFSLLVQKKFSDEVRERVFKVRRGPRCHPPRVGASPWGHRHFSVPRQILYKMLKYEKVPERCKNRLKLKDIGYQGLIACLSDIPGSMLLFRCLSEQVLGAGTVSPFCPVLVARHGAILVASQLSGAGWR